MGQTDQMKVQSKQAPKKTHLRSLTSQKGNEAENVSHGGPQRNGGRRQPSASGVSGKQRHEMNETKEAANKEHITYGQTIQN